MILKLFFSIFIAVSGQLDEDDFKVKTGKIIDTIWLEIEADGYPQGVITIGLFSELVPKTVKNFMQLALSTGFPSYKVNINRTVKSGNAPE